MAALHVGRSKLQLMNGKTRAALIQGDAQELPFVSGSFDIVVSCETIEHVPDAHAALREMWRVARKGARLFLTTPNYANLMGCMIYILACATRTSKTINLSTADSGSRRFVASFAMPDGKLCAATEPAISSPYFQDAIPSHYRGSSQIGCCAGLLSPFAYHYFLVAEKREPA